MVWIAQYGATHFATFDLLREGFLLRFREEKTRVHVLAKLGRLEQKQQEVEAYVAKFRSLIRRLDAPTTPAVPIQNAYFMEGLNKGLKQSLASLDF